jgi:hypothetical protein
MSTIAPVDTPPLRGLPGHHCPRDPEIEREHRGSQEDAGPNALPEAAGVLVATEGRAALHWHFPGPDAEVGEQPERQDEEWERTDEELQQEAASEFPGREREGRGDEDRTPNEGINLRRDGAGRKVGHQCGYDSPRRGVFSTRRICLLKEESRRGLGAGELRPGLLLPFICVSDAAETHERSHLR